MKRLTAIVVVCTLALLYWVPARGERRSGSGGSGGAVRLPDPKPYVIAPCTSGPIHYLGCVKPHGDQFWYYAENGKREDVFHYTCRRPDGKYNGSRYPCVYYRDGRYLMYAMDIY